MKQLEELKKQMEKDLCIHKFYILDYLGMNESKDQKYGIVTETAGEHY